MMMDAGGEAAVQSEVGDAGGQGESSSESGEDNELDESMTEPGSLQAEQRMEADQFGDAVAVGLPDALDVAVNVSEESSIQATERQSTDMGAGPESPNQRRLKRSWKRINCSGDIPEARSGAASVIHNGFLYVLGGYGGESRLGDFFKYCLQTQRWSCIEPGEPFPSPRENNGFVSLGNRLILMGGYDGETWLSDLWEFDTITEQWRLVDAKGQAPSPRFGFVSVTHGNKMILFGGYSGLSWLNDMYEFDFATECWTLLDDVVGEIPSKRSCPSWSLFGDSIIMFGGYDGVQRKNDLFEYDILAKRWSEIKCENCSKPSGRYFHACGVHGNSFVVFGGYDGRERLNDLYQFSFESRHWTAIKTFGEVPSGRSSLVAEIYKDSLLIFGGYNGTMVLNDFFEYPFMCVQVEPPQLRADMMRLIDHPMFSDVSFLVEGRCVRAVRAILAARSEHFRALLYGGMRESQQQFHPPRGRHEQLNGAGAAAGGLGPDDGNRLKQYQLEHEGSCAGGGESDQIVLHDMRYDVFMAVLEYLYTDSVSISADLAIPLLIASERYLLPRLKSLCEDTIFRGINHENAIYILLQSYLHNAHSLKNICLTYIVDNISVLRCRPQFQALKQEPELLMDIIMRSTAVHSTP